MTIEYCVFCPSCNSPIPIGSVHSSDEHAQLVLASLTLTCQSCDRRYVHQGEPAIFSRTGKYAYWGVVCGCGAFQPVLRATLDHRERVPSVKPFQILCSHRRRSPNHVLIEQSFDKTRLRKVEWEEEIQNFQPHPILQ